MTDRDGPAGRVGPEQLQRFEGWIAEIFETLGMPRDTAGTRRTPARFLAALYDSTEGYERDPEVPASVASEGDRGHAVEGPIRFHALCEHHALPFFGHAFVGCAGPHRAVAPGALTSVVRTYARRFTVPARVSEQIADALEGLVQARGAAVVLRCVHLCAPPRQAGVASATPTAVWRGAYATDPRLRSEFLGICGLGPVDAASPAFGGRSCRPDRAEPRPGSPSWGRERRETPSCTGSERPGSTAGSS